MKDTRSLLRVPLPKFMEVRQINKPGSVIYETGFFSWSWNSELHESVTSRSVKLNMKIQTAIILMTFIVMMIRHPEVAKKAQAEIDEVIGSDQLPSLQDRDNLPYIDCILKEVMRCVPQDFSLALFLIEKRSRVNPSVPLGE